MATLVDFEDECAKSASPLVVLAGPTASGKTALALALAERFDGEIVSCDSVAVYRGMEIGTAKPTLAERACVPHHLIDVFTPDQPCTAGDYCRLAREAIAGISQRGRLAIVAGGTGLYLRALLDGLFAAPARDESLRARLRQRAELHGTAYLHRILTRMDPDVARLIHANDAPKVIRAIEVTLAARSPITRQWQQQPRDPLTGFHTLRLCLNPPRAELYERINRRAAAMFETGLIEETAQLIAEFGQDCRPLTSLGYAQAAALLRDECSREEAIAAAQQGHRNYAKRQITWFRKDSELQWLAGFGGEPEIERHAFKLVEEHLVGR